MPARLLDGSALSAALRRALAGDVEALSSTGRRPGLAVVLVGDDPASQVYVRNKVRACADAGIRSELRRLPDDVTEAGLLDVIERFNADDGIDGILVQMPLPPHLSPARVLETIGVDKDVDGFHLSSAGALLHGRIEDGIGFLPCTPYGVMRLLDSAAVPIAGRHAVVIGRSNTVGKPMALMLLARDATVTLCHSRTRDLPEIVRTGDIVVSAVGRAATVTADMIKPGAAVVDVGINRDAAGKLVGDVDATVREVAGWLSPVPGGVGPMTIAMLLENTVLAARRRQAHTTPTT